MKIGLYNLEPKFKNLALEKIRLYYSTHGHEVLDCSPQEAQLFDQVYCSSLFNWTNKKYVAPNMIYGGTGFDLTTELPPKIEAMRPKLNFGFTTRGCIRKCKFCVVPEKEGMIHAVGDLMDLWDGRSKQITLFDNNILAMPSHFEYICQQARTHKIQLDFNQGLDHRLLTDSLIDCMKTIRHHEYRFAWDNPNSIDSVAHAIDLLSFHGIRRNLWYVLVGFDTTLEQDLFRLNYLKSRNQNAYVQRFRKNGQPFDPKYIPLARWANQHHIFQGMTWEQFLKHPANKGYRVYENKPLEV